MATEGGHAPLRCYVDQSGNFHTNGSNLFDPAENTLAQKVTFTPAVGAANITLVTVQVTDGNGVALAAVFELCLYLSDAATGAGLTATTASGAVAAGASGTDLSAKVSKKALDVLTDATGKYILSITDTSKTGFYVCAVCPGTGITWIGTQLTAANYG